jgi:23S rRNA (pseudouridine1915-N3)-methyltransferase
MRVMLAAVGKLKDGGERDLCERYIKRFDQSGRALALGPLTVVELPESRLGDAPLRKADESMRLLKATGACDVLIALDEYGSHDTSLTFADRLARWRDDGAVRVGFLIGGADGHGETVKSSAHAMLSLGRMTLPHGLVRVILAEQLYRATTILAGHPYHRS